MKFSTIAFGALLAPLATLGLPINANGTAAVNSGIQDLDILQFALTLEYLEITLYELGVNTFNDQAFQDAGYGVEVRERFEEIIGQERMHISRLQDSIYQAGGTPTQPCQYNFGKLESVQGFLNTTDVVNGLGPSAYLGAGAFVKDKVTLTVGASIGNIETRHNSWLNGVIHRDEFPTTYLLPLSPAQSYGVASQFITSCPDSNPQLNAVTAFFPALTITNKGAPGTPLFPGSTVYLQPGEGYKGASQVNAAFLYGFNTTIVPLNSDNTAQLPSDIAGQSYVVLTTAYNGETLNDQNSLTNPQAFFVDVPASNFANTNYGEYDYS